MVDRGEPGAASARHKAATDGGVQTLQTRILTTAASSRGAATSITIACAEAPICLAILPVPHFMRDISRMGVKFNAILTRQTAQDKPGRGCRR